MKLVLSVSAAVPPIMVIMLPAPPDMAPTLSTPSTAVTASITASAAAKASAFSVSSETVTLMESWLLSISGKSTTPMVTTRQTERPSRATATRRAQALCLRHFRSRRS